MGMKTPKQYADDLINEFWENLPPENNFQNKYTLKPSHYNEFELAKELADITVDKILESNPTVINFDNTELNYGYYIEVKKQIKLKTKPHDN